MMRLLAAIAIGLLLPVLPVAAQESPATPAATEQAERAAATPQADASKPADTPPKPAADAQSATAKQGKFNTVDRMELDATAITGNRELPKVLYIVPWKKADL